MGHLVEHPERVAKASESGVHGGERGGGVEVRDEASFEEMGMERLALRDASELGTGFEERRESESVRSSQMGIERESFSVGSI